MPNLDIDNIYMLDEYSNFFAFLGKFDYIRSLRDEPDKKSDDSACATESTTGFKYGGVGANPKFKKDERAENILYVYGSKAAGVDVFEEWASTELKMKDSRYAHGVITLPEKKDDLDSPLKVNKWLQGLFAATGIKTPCTDWAIEQQEKFDSGSGLSGDLLDLGGSLFDVIVGIAGSPGSIPQVGGLFVLASRMAIKGFRDFKTKKFAFGQISKEQAKNDADIIKSVDARKEGRNVFDSRRPFEFILLDIEKFCADNVYEFTTENGYTATISNKKAVIFVKNFERYISCFTKSGEHDYKTQFLELIAKKTPEIIWVLFSDSKPDESISKYMWNDNIWNISPYDEPQAVRYLSDKINCYKKVNFAEDEDDELCPDFSEEAYFEEWAKSIYEFTGGYRRLINYCGQIQNNQEKSFVYWLKKAKLLDKRGRLDLDIDGGILIKTTDDAKKYSDEIRKLSCEWLIGLATNVNDTANVFHQIIVEQFGPSYEREPDFWTLCYLADRSVPQKSVAYAKNEEKIDIMLRGRIPFCWKTIDELGEIKDESVCIISEFVNTSPFIICPEGVGGYYFVSSMMAYLLPLNSKYEFALSSFRKTHIKPVVDMDSNSVDYSLRDTVVSIENTSSGKLIDEFISEAVIAPENVESQRTLTPESASNLSDGAAVLHEVDTSETKKSAEKEDKEGAASQDEQDSQDKPPIDIKEGMAVPVGVGGKDKPDSKKGSDGIAGLMESVVRHDMGLDENDKPRETERNDMTAQYIRKLSEKTGKVIQEERDKKNPDDDPFKGGPIKGGSYIPDKV